LYRSPKRGGGRFVCPTFRRMGRRAKAYEAIPRECGSKACPSATQGVGRAPSTESSPFGNPYGTLPASRRKGYARRGPRAVPLPSTSSGGPYPLRVTPLPRRARRTTLTLPVYRHITNPPGARVGLVRAVLHYAAADHPPEQTPTSSALPLSPQEAEKTKMSTSYRRAALSRRDKKGGKGADLTQEQKQEIR